MKIAVVGTGYVGLVSGACLAKMGNEVSCVDVDSDKIECLNRGQVPIYEPGLAEIIAECKDRGMIKFSTDLSFSIADAEAIFIAVGTPMSHSGEADLSYVYAVARQIGQSLNSPAIVIDKSTVPVGTATKVRQIIKGELDARGVNVKFDVVSNPEFLKEGAAVEDFLKPDRVVVGASSEWAFSVLRRIYSPFMKNHDRLIEMDEASAEMTKYAANCMLATKISFINEMANICELVGADINLVRKGIGSDGRIGYSFIYAGCGYGGSCFPKDIDALIYTAKSYGFTPHQLLATKERNIEQKRVLFDKINRYFNGELKGKKIAIWGLSFKPNTDDMREASSLSLISFLAKAGASMVAYDPKAMKEAAIYLKRMGLEGAVNFADDKYLALNGADALALVTEWSEFRSPDFKRMIELLSRPVIFDGRNQYDANLLKSLGFDYFQIGARA